MSTFGFFHSISLGLANLLERTELFGVSQDIREQLVLALTDLVTLVASVATHFHKAISGMTTASASIDIYEVFGHQIHTFSDRCEKIAESMWRHQLWKENIEGEKGMSMRPVTNFVAVANCFQSVRGQIDPVLAHSRRPGAGQCLRGYLSVCPGPRGNDLPLVATVPGSFPEERKA